MVPPRRWLARAAPRVGKRLNLKASRDAFLSLRLAMLVWEKGSIQTVEVDPTDQVEGMKCPRNGMSCRRFGRKEWQTPTPVLIAAAAATEDL